MVSKLCTYFSYLLNSEKLIYTINKQRFKLAGIFIRKSLSRVISKQTLCTPYLTYKYEERLKLTLLKQVLKQLSLSINPPL